MILVKNAQYEYIEIEENLIVRSEDKIYYFSEFERGLLDYFNGKNDLEVIINDLKKIFPNSFNEVEFLEFVTELQSRKILI